MKQLLTIVALIAATACASQKSLKVEANTTWHLVSLSDFEGAVSDEAVIDFGSGLKSFHATTGCNSINGTLSVSGSAITFGDGPMTKMMCHDGGLELTFVQALHTVDNYAINSDTLTLRVGDRVVMKLSK